MPFELEYGSLANYSPRGNSELSQRSRRICSAIKRGTTGQIEFAVSRLKQPISNDLWPFLNPAVTLVPVPRSAPLADGALWPAKVIVDILQANSLGGSVVPLIDRISPVRKSSTSPANERPLIYEHIESLRLSMELANPAEITLVDDVLTMGRTMCACAKLLAGKFPDVKIRAFAMVRTQGLVDDIEKILDPSTGIITGYSSGKAHREP